MKLSSIAAVTAMPLLAGACAAETVTDPAGDLPALVCGNTEFALDLFGRLSQDSPDDNLFFSPFSISAALAMTAAGAEGETGVQMADVLGFTLPGPRVHPAFSLLLEQLSPDYRASLCSEGQEPLTLEIANALWVEETFPLLAAFVGLVEEEYWAEARNVDFIGDPDAQRIVINDWVSDRTRGRIQDLLAPGVISGMTRVVLANAIYFLGAWQSQFQEGATRDEEFTRMDGTVIETPMMHQTEPFAFSRGNGCSAVSLPYSDGLSSMLILLPDGDIGVFEGSLDLETLEAIRGSLQRIRISLSMPRFEFSSSLMLKDMLIALGMTDAFDPALADFSGLTGGRDLFISAVIHKAFVKVDETGTEAAAATAVIMALTSAAPPPSLELVLDRPFLFLILDDQSGSILFMGRVADPSV
jgi:serpin B